MRDTIPAKRGGCAFGRVCKRISQALARRSDLRAMQAQHGSPAIKPGCLCVCACACVCLCPTRHQTGVRWRMGAWSRGKATVCLRTRIHARIPTHLDRVVTSQPAALLLMSARPCYRPKKTPEYAHTSPPSLLPCASPGRTAPLAPARPSRMLRGRAASTICGPSSRRAAPMAECAAAT